MDITGKSLPHLSKYVVREDGEIVSLFGKKPRTLKGGRDKDGYVKFVLIGDDGERRHVRRATMVCEAFYGARPAGMTVRHMDGSRTNDAKDNVRWDTHSVNCQDKLAHGTAQRGVNNGNAVISEDVARRIKGSLHLTTKELMSLTGASKAIVNNIRHGNAWSWL